MKINESKLRQLIRESIMEEISSDNNLDINAQFDYMIERLQRLSQELQSCKETINNILNESLSELNQIFGGNANIVDIQSHGNELYFTLNITREQIANAVVSDENLFHDLTGEFGDFSGMNPEQVKQNVINDPGIPFDYLMENHRRKYNNGYSLSFEYYGKPDMVIETPINFGEFDGINNIIDF